MGEAWHDGWVRDRRPAYHFKGNQGGPKEGGLNIGQHEGLNMQRIENKIRSNQLLPSTPIPWNLLRSLYNHSFEEACRDESSKADQDQDLVSSDRCAVLIHHHADCLPTIGGPGHDLAPGILWESRVYAQSPYCNYLY